MIADTRDRLASAERRNTRLRNSLFLLGTLAMVAIVAGIAVYLNRSPTDAIPSEVTQRLDPKLQVLSHRLVGEPCNRTIAAQLVSALLKQAEYDAIVRFAEKTNASCGPNEELLTAVYTAQLRTG